MDIIPFFVGYDKEKGKAKSISEPKQGSVQEVICDRIEKIEESAEGGHNKNAGAVGKKGRGRCLGGLLTYYIEDERNYIVDKATVSCNMMSCENVSIAYDDGSIKIYGEGGKAVWKTESQKQSVENFFSANMDKQEVGELRAVHAREQTNNGLNFATVTDCVCKRDEDEEGKIGEASLTSMGNCKIIRAEDIAEIIGDPKRMKKAQEYGTCYCLMKPAEEWVNPMCMEEAGNISGQSYCTDSSHHKTMEWSTVDGKKEGITMLSTLLCTRGGIITIKWSGQIYITTEKENALMTIQNWKERKGISNRDVHNAIEILSEYMNIEEVMDYITVRERLWIDLRFYGYNKIATAAIMGNIAVESPDFKTDQLQGTLTEPKAGLGMGLFQWSFSSRQDGLYSLAKDMGLQWDDYEVQIAYFIKEVEEEPRYVEVKKENLNNKNLYDAVKTFAVEYEEAGKLGLSKRNQGADEAYADFAEWDID